MRIKYQSGYPGEKRAHSRALAAPQIFPLKGDSNHVWSLARSGGGRLYRGYAATDADRRAALVEARYADWQAAYLAAVGKEVK